MSGQTHIVGPAIAWNDPEDGVLVRQRCSWCGALIREDPIERMAVMVDPPNPDTTIPIPDWPVGELIRLEGTNPEIRSIVDAPVDDQTGERAADAEVAPDCCLLLDPEVTR